MWVCHRILDIITGVDMLSHYGWSNTTGRVCLQGLLMIKPLLSFLPYKEKLNWLCLTSLEHLADEISCD